MCCLRVKSGEMRTPRSRALSAGFVVHDPHVHGVLTITSVIDLLDTGPPFQTMLSRLFRGPPTQRSTERVITVYLYCIKYSIKTDIQFNRLFQITGSIVIVN